MTNDPAVMAAAIETPHPFRRTIVYLRVDGPDDEQVTAVERLFARYKRLVPGRLYTVTAGRVKIRQLPRHRRGGHPEAAFNVE